jgi:hypothetical protein
VELAQLAGGVSLWFERAFREGRSLWHPVCCDLPVDAVPVLHCVLAIFF